MCLGLNLCTFIFILGNFVWEKYTIFLSSKHNDVIINLYYTPTVLTTNSLIFNKDKMLQWWERGFEFAKRKNIDLNAIRE